MEWKMTREVPYGPPETGYVPVLSLGAQRIADRLGAPRADGSVVVREEEGHIFVLCSPDLQDKVIGSILSMGRIYREDCVFVNEIRVVSSVPGLTERVKNAAKSLTDALNLSVRVRRKKKTRE